MAFDLKRKAYERMPLVVKRLLGVIPFSLIAGRKYRIVLRKGYWLDLASRADVLAYQEETLGRVLQFAVTEVPAYHSLATVVARYRPFEALEAFPFLDKDMLQADQASYLPASFGSIAHYQTTTGGTSGNQLRIYLDDESQSVEMAFMHRQWKRVGYRPKHRKATFRGVPFPNLKPGIFWQYNPIYNELQFSPFHMSENNLAAYVNQIIQFKPSYFHGYPSALDALAEYVIRNDLTDQLPAIRAVLLGSEGATAQQRVRIERAFRTRAYSWYGHSERVILAGECEQNDTYHHFPDYGVLEIVDEAGRLCDKEGERGEIVGTGLLNRCMPLIRYRTGDFATRLEPRCECGRAWDRFTAVEGRWKQEMVLGRSGARISIAALNMHGPLFERVVRYQYQQNQRGFCVLKIMPAPHFSDIDRLSIEAAYRQKVGDEVDMRVELVTDIPLTPRGKLKMLVSSLE